MIKISIIIPIYNSALTLQRCLDSIILQTYQNWEAILINDGSSDTSLEICKKYIKKDNRFYLFDIPNGGVSHARNVGISHASGDYITFVDSDDYILENYLFDSMISCSDLIVTNYKRPQTITKQIYRENHIDILFKQLALRTVWAKFFLNNIIKQNQLKFDENIRFAEDTLFVLNYIKYISSVTYVFEKLYIYVNPPYSSVAKYNTSLKEYLYIMDKLQNITKRLEHISYDVVSLKKDNTDALCWPYMIYLYTSGHFSFTKRYIYYNLFKKQKQTETCWCIDPVLLPVFKIIEKVNCFFLIDVCFKINFLLMYFKSKIRITYNNFFK